MNKNEIMGELNKYNIQNAYILATFDNMVCIGKLENNELCFYEDVNFDFCSQIRIFNKLMELKVYKIDNQIYSKLIKDDDFADKLDDEYMFVIGNKIINKDEKFTVVKQVGKKMAIPLQLTDADIEKGIRLVVRNYCQTQAITDENELNNNINDGKKDSNPQVIIPESRLVGFSLDGKEVI